MMLRRCAGIGLCLMMANGLEEECYSSEAQEFNFLQMQLSLDSVNEEDGIIDTIKSIFQGNAAKSKKRAAAIVEKKKSSNMEASNATENVTDVSNASNGSNVTDHLKEVHERLVVDRRNFSQLLHDLSHSKKELATAEALTEDFEDALLQAASAKHQVETAQEARDDNLERIHKLLGVTIQKEKLLDENLPLEEAVRLSNPLVESAKIAAKTAEQVANLTEAVRKTDEIILRSSRAYSKALQDQTGNVTRIQALLRTAILREMNDTRLVQVLDASDRISGTVTVTTTMTTTTETREVPKVIVVVPDGNFTSTESSTTVTTTKSQTSKPAQSTTQEATETTTTTQTDNAASGNAGNAKLGLYPSDWAVIGSLILLGVLVALITIYSRTVGG